MQNHEGQNAPLIGVQCFLSPGLHPSFAYMLAGFTRDCSSPFVLVASFLISKTHNPLQITQERKQPTTELWVGNVSALHIKYRLIFSLLFLNQQ